MNKRALITTAVCVVFLAALVFVLKFISVPNPLTSPKADFTRDTRPPGLEISLVGGFTEIIDFFKGVSFDEPHDIYIDAYGCIFVADAGADCIYKFDKDGNLMKTIGSSGSGGGEFNYPTAFCFDEKALYVADNMNHRVQILDGKNYSYVGEITLEENTYKRAEYYTSMTCGGTDELFLSGNFIMGDSCYTYRIDLDPIQLDQARAAKFQRIDGYLRYYGGTLYMVETYELKASQGSYMRVAGKHNLTSYTKGAPGLTYYFEFPLKYMPADFIIEDGLVYVLSMMHQTLDLFTLEGEYKGTLHQAGDISDFCYLEKDADGAFYISCPMDASVIRLVPNGGG